MMRRAPSCWLLVVALGGPAAAQDGGGAERADAGRELKVVAPYRVEEVEHRESDVVVVSRRLPSSRWRIRLDGVSVDAGAGRIVARLDELAPEDAGSAEPGQGRRRDVRIDLGRLPAGRFVLELHTRRETEPEHRLEQALVLSVDGSEDADGGPLALPDDPKAEVVALYENLSLEAQMHVEESHARLRVLADGTVVVGDPYGRKWKGQPKPDYVPELRGRLEPDELRALVRFLLEDVDLDDFDSEAVKDASVADLADGDTMVVETHVGGRETRAWVYGLDQVREPQAELARFRRAVGRLEALRQRFIDAHESEGED